MKRNKGLIATLILGFISFILVVLDFLALIDIYKESYPNNRFSCVICGLCSCPPFLTEKEYYPGILLRKKRRGYSWMYYRRVR